MNVLNTNSCLLQSSQSHNHSTYIPTELVLYIKYLAALAPHPLLPHHINPFRHRLPVPSRLPSWPSASYSEFLDMSCNIAIMSVCLSRSGITLKRLNISSYFLQHTVAQSLWFSRTQNIFAKFRRDPRYGRVEYRCGK